MSFLFDLQLRLQLIVDVIFAIHFVRFMSHVLRELFGEHLQELYQIRAFLFVLDASVDYLTAILVDHEPRAAEEVEEIAGSPHVG